MNFATLQGLTTPEGVVTQIADASGRVLWQVSGGKVVLEVEKITSNTYNGEVVYTGEEFILLDIYPKTNGTVNVTYGGLTKTITDTSGAEEPNAQQVFFGTFNGVSDSVATPASGELIIKGDCYAFGCSSVKLNGKTTITADCVTAIKDFGGVTTIPESAFKGCTALSGNISIPESVSDIGNNAFYNCTGIEKMVISSETNFTPQSFVPFGANTEVEIDGGFLTVDENHPIYAYKGSCFITKSDNTVVCGFRDAVIPSGVSHIGEKAFYYIRGLSSVFVISDGVKSIGTEAFTNSSGITDLTIPSSVTNIGSQAFFFEGIERVTVHAITPPIVPDDGKYLFQYIGLGNSNNTFVSLTVPKGCGAAYKAAVGWSKFADRIVEGS